MRTALTQEEYNGMRPNSEYHVPLEILIYNPDNPNTKEVILYLLERCKYNEAIIKKLENTIEEMRAAKDSNPN